MGSAEKCGRIEVNTLVPNSRCKNNHSLDFLQLKQSLDPNNHSAELMENFTKVILGGLGAQFSRVMSRTRVLSKPKDWGKDGTPRWDT